jgi:16S rRNA (adenine1518-N6/adenine1519-N6)-dimethyltransferase
LKRVTPKKFLGQHFLKDENIASKIVNSLNVDNAGSIIEVGPGMGVLTKSLLAHPQFIAYDIDAESIDYLKKLYPNHTEKFAHRDFLKSNLNEMNKPIKIIGNFPYNISSQLFFQIYESRRNVDEVVCMIQKEVADRIVSKEGNKVYGILSVLLQAYYNITYLFTVKPGVFIPPPKVNSAVIKLKRNDVLELACDEKLFKTVVKMGFGKRRKTLRNALKELNLPLEITNEPVFEKRAEQLSVDQFIALTKMIRTDGRDSTI